MKLDPTASNPPLLTVVMPCYNVEAYLEKGLNSFQDERFNGMLEVLIINDGSTDSTAQIAQGYVEKMPGIFRLINKENGGHGSGVNTGIAEATGKYFRVIDGDDWVNTENLVLFLRKLENIDSDIVVDEKTEVDMTTGNTLRCSLPSYINSNVEQFFEDICNNKDTESYISIHTLTTRTSLLRQHDIRVLEKIFYEDYEYIVKTTCYAKTVTFLDLDVYQYLVGNVNQSVAAENYVKRYKQHESIVDELLQFSKASSFSPAIEEYLNTKIQLLINTHYNILLIFDTNRKRGLKRAKEFRSWLQKEYPSFATATDKRYNQAYLLHKLGFNQEKLNKLMGRQ